MNKGYQSSTGKRNKYRKKGKSTSKQMARTQAIHSKGNDQYMSISKKPKKASQWKKSHNRLRNKSSFKSVYEMVEEEKVQKRQAKAKFKDDGGMRLNKMSMQMPKTEILMKISEKEESTPRYTYRFQTAGHRLFP